MFNLAFLLSNGWRYYFWFYVCGKYLESLLPFGIIQVDSPWFKPSRQNQIYVTNIEKHPHNKISLFESWKDDVGIHSQRHGWIMISCVQCTSTQFENIHTPKSPMNVRMD